MFPEGSRQPRRAGERRTLGPFKIGAFKAAIAAKEALAKRGGGGVVARIGAEGWEQSLCGRTLGCAIFHENFTIHDQDSLSNVTDVIDVIDGTLLR